MPLLIGRLGDGLDGLEITLRAVDEWSWSNGSFRVKGVIHVPLANADLKSSIGSGLRYQMMGMISNPEQQVIPFRWHEDVTIDGLYKITSGDIGFLPGHSWREGIYPFTLQLQRATAHSTPLFESRFAGGVLTNDHSITSANVPLWMGLSNGAIDIRTAGTTTLSTNRSGAGRIPSIGDTLYYLESDIATSERTAFWSIPVTPVRYYRGAVTIETIITAPQCSPDDDSPYMVVTGNAWERKPDQWRMSNGLVRVTPTFQDASDSSLFAVEVHNGTSWGEEKRYRVEGVLNHGLIENSDERQYAAVIRRNSPEESSIYMIVPSGYFPIGRSRLRVTFSMRRGSRFVGVLIQYDRPSGTAGTHDNFRIRREDAEAATTLTGGIRATSNDSDGNRFIIATNKAFSTDAVNGGVTHTGQTKPHYFAIGAEVGGSSAAAHDTAQNVIYQAHAGISEYVRARLSQDSEVL